MNPDDDPLAELNRSLETAYAALMHLMSERYEPDPEYYRLRGKAEGVSLAISRLYDIQRQVALYETSDR